MKPMIHVVATIELAEGKRDDFLKRVRQLVPEVRAEKGCMEYGPAIDFPTGIKAQMPLRGNVVVMLEKWQDVKSLEAHLGAPHMLKYREDVKGMVVKTQLQVLQPA
jgi:quinol monooxygenase YgiN